MTRRWTLCASLALAGLAMAAQAPATAAADYPSKAIHIVVPWAAGGGTDAIGRGFAEALRKIVKEAVVVDNIAGAGGITGSVKVVESAPDGHTLLLNGSSDMTTAMALKDLPVSLDDFVYIGGFFETPTWILSHKDAGITSLAQFLDKAKANPGKVTIGTGGPTGAQIFMAAGIKGITNADFRVIPYSGGNDLKKALLGNQVDAGIIHSPVMLAEVKEGLIRVIGTGMPLTRITYEPVRGVKTLKDHNIPISIGITRGLFAPKATSKEIAAKIEALAEQAAKSETFREFGIKFGFEPVWIPGADFERDVRQELATYKDIKKKYIQ